jgi:hypothetical protein
MNQWYSYNYFKMSGWRERQAKKVEEEKTRHLEVNEINFPSLTSNDWSEQPKSGSKKPIKSFASLAKEWSEHAEQVKMRTDVETEQRRIEEYEREQIRKRRGAYNFGSSHAREEDTYYETADDEYLPESNADTSEDWRTIAKKVRKPRTTNFNSVVFQPPPPQEDETVWEQDPYE